MYLQSSSCLSSSCPPVAPAPCSFFFSTGGLSEVNRMFVWFITFLRLKNTSRWLAQCRQICHWLLFCSAAVYWIDINLFSLYFISHMQACQPLVEGNQQTHGKKNRRYILTDSSKSHEILFFHNKDLTNPSFQHFWSSCDHLSRKNLEKILTGKFSMEYRSGQWLTYVFKRYWIQAQITYQIWYKS